MIAKDTGVIYIQRHRLQIFTPALQSVVEFRYVPELIADMDVINKELFERIVDLFIENTKIPKGNMVIVLSDSACFIKDFIGQNVNADDLKDKAKEFIEHTPFENVCSRIFPIKNGIRAFATNGELFDAIKESFEKEKFSVEAVIPGFLMEENLSMTQDLMPQTAMLMLQKVNSLRQHDLLRPEVGVKKTVGEPASAEIPEVKEEKPEKPEKIDKKRLLVLVGVFVSLMATLVVVYFINYPITPPSQTSQASQPTSSPAVKGTKTSKVLSTATPSAEIADGKNINTPTATITRMPTVTPFLKDQTKNLTVQIVNASGSAPQAKLLMEKLDGYGFEKIYLQQGGIRSTNTMITFSPNVPTELRTSIYGEVVEISDGIRIEEKEKMQYDIVIILVK